MNGLRPEDPATCPEKLIALLNDCWETRPHSIPSFVEICMKLEEVRHELFRGLSSPEGFEEFIRIEVKEHSAIQRVQHIARTDSTSMFDSSSARNVSILHNTALGESLQTVDEDTVMLDSSPATGVSIFYSTALGESLPLIDEVANKDSGIAEPPSTSDQTSEYYSARSEAMMKGRSDFGISSMELFTPEQIHEHITGFRQWVGLSKARAEANQAMEHPISLNACSLCAVEILTFQLPLIYCTACGTRIKQNAKYYTTGSGDTRHYFCVPCYNEVRSENVEMEDLVYPKAKLEKKKNDKEVEEAWVQCVKSNLRQHQVCALFNDRRNERDKEYICPQCCCLQMEAGVRKPVPPSAVEGAEDLPKTSLSDHLEQRLAWKLKQERAERAKAERKTIDEVPGAEALVVRVASPVDKKLEVRQRFFESFQEEDYPTEFPYRSKVVLLFQKIDGVEVCLFGMHVQEFGVESSLPNQRRVYLSDLDSVEYFRPDVRTANGEALRIFVYHEILIGYLDYCRKRGFSSCYLWACPPLEEKDYIFYCHPDNQKTPKSDKLRDWYLTMLRILQLRKMLELLVHASQSGLGTCQYLKCRSLKSVFRHAMNCRIRVYGGCNMWKRMWYLLQLHARACKESECRVPRCKDLEEHVRRLQHQMESRRRVAVMDMMRQRAAPEE